MRKYVVRFLIFFCWLLFVSIQSTLTAPVSSGLNFFIKNYTHQEHPDVVFLFSHGLASTQRQATDMLTREQHKKNSRWLIDEPLALFDYPDARTDDTKYHRHVVNLGQELDIEQLHQAYQKTLKHFPQSDIVLVGISRGSATIINYIAQHQPKRLRAIVLECPFDHINFVIPHILRRYKIHWVPFSKKLATRIVKNHFPTIDLNGIFPIKVVDLLPKNLPIMIIHSKKDSIIPIKSAWRLYKKLIETNHEHAYLVELKSGSHGHAILGPDGDYYQLMVHTFFKRYQVPFDPQKASHDFIFLDECKHSIDTINAALQRKRMGDIVDEDPDDQEIIDELVV